MRAGQRGRLARLLLLRSRRGRVASVQTIGQGGDMAGANQAGFAAANLNPKGQTLEGVQKIVASILGHLGCSNCGRLARLRVELLGDPPLDLAKENVISFQMGGFGH